MKPWHVEVLLTSSERILFRVQVNWPTHDVSLLSGHTSFLSPSLSLILIQQESAYLTFHLDTQVSEHS
jgi:hypothetical protein